MAELVQGRLDAAIPATGEAFHELCQVCDTRIEHIVSSAQPDIGEQVQGWEEWVLVTVGAALVDFDGDARRLTSGDWLLIPAGTPHRVLSTDPGTQWIAVHGPVPPDQH